MLFKEVIGQDELKKRVRQEVIEGRIAHAQLFSGARGSGKLPMALALARFILCRQRTENDSCGICPSCRKVTKLAHPDLHFVFPVIKRNNATATISDDYLPKWRELIAQKEGYFDLNHWLEMMGAENQQAVIYTAESNKIQQKLCLKSSEGGYKVMIIWLPEKMVVECANKLLKIFEEPPTETLFILVTEEREMLLPTVRSRMQETRFKRIANQEIQQALTIRYELSNEQASEVAYGANGDFIKAIETIHTHHTDEDSDFFLHLFITLMRMSYQRKIKEMKLWSEQVAGMGRERQKEFLHYCQTLVRENFIYNFGQSELNHMSAEERRFSEKFAPFVNENNIISITEELASAQRDIEQNANPRMVFFDLALKMIVMLIQKK